MTVSTPEASVPGGPLGWSPVYRPAPRRSRWPVVVALGVVLALVAVGALFVQLPYYAISPGSARQVNDLIRVTGGRAYPPRGEVLFTTVSLGPVQNVYEAIDGWLDPAIDLVPERQILGDAEDRQQYQQQNVQAMASSKEIAEYVAFRKLGYDVAVRGEGALVVEVEPQYPAAKLLRAGDVVVAADGKPVALSDDLVAAIRAHRPGETVALSVVTAGSPEPPRTVEAPLVAREDGSPLLGIKLQTFRQRFAFPFRVDIESGAVGGPSAGLAFTLAILDLLTPGELTGGARVAVTGTINADGSVGPVGGVAQKTVAVRRAGATLFIVPSAEFAIAKARAGGSLRVEKADTLDEALHVLATIRGSNALALAGPGGTGTRG